VIIFAIGLYSIDPISVAGVVRPPRNCAVVDVAEQPRPSPNSRYYVGDTVGLWRGGRQRESPPAREGHPPEGGEEWEPQWPRQGIPWNGVVMACGDVAGNTTGVSLSVVQGFCYLSVIGLYSAVTRSLARQVGSQ